VSIACRPECAIAQASVHLPTCRSASAATHYGAVFIAHAAHWVGTLAYVSPVVCIAIWLIAAQQRERRRARCADCTNAQADSAPSALP
jgi:hypothetical protein